MMPKEQLTFAIGGMHCAGCVNRVTNALKKLSGVEIQTVEVGSAQVLVEEAGASARQIQEAIRKIGFTAEETVRAR